MYYVCCIGGNDRVYQNWYKTCPELHSFYDLYEKILYREACTTDFKVEEGLASLSWARLGTTHHILLCWALSDPTCLEPLHPSHLGTLMPSTPGLEGRGYASPPAWSLENAAVSYRCCVAASWRQSRIQSTSYSLSSFTSVTVCSTESFGIDSSAR